jgi:hypothetical protein
VRVKVYYNLHRKMFSVVSLEAHDRYGRVIDHRKFITLDNVGFRVNPAGRARCRREKRKNVHAFVVGTISAVQEQSPPGEAEIVIYNPYMYNSFVLKDSAEPVYAAKKAWLTKNYVSVVDILKP